MAVCLPITKHNLILHYRNTCTARTYVVINAICIFFVIEELNGDFKPSSAAEYSTNIMDFNSKKTNFMIIYKVLWWWSPSGHWDFRVRVKRKIGSRRYDDGNFFLLKLKNDVCIYWKDILRNLLTRIYFFNELEKLINEEARWSDQNKDTVG